MPSYKFLLPIVSLCMIAATPVSAIGPGDTVFNGFLWSPPGNGNGWVGCGIWQGTVQCSGGPDIANEGAIAFCYSSDARMKKLVAGINKTSNVQFAYNAQGVCTLVQTINGWYGGATVRAGAKQAQQVSVYSAYGVAWGSISAVSVPTENISCSVAASDGGGNQVVCSATDRSGNSVLCSSSADSASQTLADQMLAASSINESSHIYFNFDNSSPTRKCTAVSVFNSSLYLP
jgi:hypothetical protein